MFAVVWFVVFVAFVFYIISLGERIRKLEEKVFTNESLNRDKSTPKEVSFDKEPLVDKNASTFSAFESKKPHFQEDVFINKFTQWLKEDWLLKLGSLLILIGFGWFVSYAFLNNWIGPMGRITFGVLVGSALLLFGFLRSKKYLHQGSVFMVLGSAVVIMTLYAARVIYNFFTPTSALLVMFLTCVFIAFSSIRHNIRWLAYVSVFLSSALPLFVNSPVKDYVGLFTYLAVVISGSIWVSLVSKIRGVLLASLLVFAIYSVPHFLQFTPDKNILLLYAYFFAAIFFVFSTLGLLKTNAQISRSDLVLSVGNGLLLLTWIMSVAPVEWRSLIISSWMIVFLTGAFLVYKKSQKKESFYAMASVGLAMLTAAISAELNGYSLTLALTVQMALVPLANYSITKDLKTTKMLCLLLLAPGFLSLPSITADEWLKGMLHGHFFVLVVLGISLMILGFKLRQVILQLGDENRYVHRTLIIAGSVYFYILVWLCLHAIIKNDDTATATALVFYTLAGLVKYFYGKFTDSRVFLIYGGITLGGVVLRLLLVDVWGMALARRIVTFFLIGILLVATAFIGRPERKADV
ncbi:MAG: DUF2339 domain-containing protein [Patescibacteria group bacterium]|nr:DUF2339 domain-containing protein [Patescibacteria group bacterium]